MSRALAVLLLLHALAACGVKGDPRLGDEDADDFPRTYPQGAVPRDPPPVIFERGRR